MASYQPQDSGSPTVLKSRRELLLKQMADALSTKPVQGGWGEALARIGTAGILGWQEGQIADEEKAGQASAAATFNSMFAPSAAAAPSMAPMADATSPTDAVTQTLAGGAPAPSFAGGQQKMAMPADPDIENRFIGQLKAGGLTNPNGLAAMAAYANAESRYSPKNIVGSWSDPSQSGQPGTSGGILSWRGSRLEAMRQATRGADDPVTAQAKFALTENPDLTVALQNAKTPEEAHSLMANAWRFAGYDRPGGEADRRLGLTRQYLAKVGGGEVAGAPMPPTRPDGIQVASAGPGFAPQMPPQAGGQMPPGAGLQTPSQVLVAQAQQRAGATPPSTSAVGPAMAQAMPQQPMQGRPQVPANPLDRITQTLAGNPQARAAMQVLQSPWATEGQKVGAKMVLEAATKEPKGPERMTVDGTVLEFPVGGGAPRPVYQAPQDQWREAIDARGNHVERNLKTGQIRVLTPADRPTDEMREYDLHVRQGGKEGFTEWKTGLRKAGASNVSVETKAEDEFSKTFGRKQAEMFGGLLEQGSQTQSKLAQIGMLREAASQVPTGFAGAAARMASNLGIPISGATEVQQFESLVSQMVPGQRAPGSGTMSDRDLDLFRASLPRLINTPEGNKRILDSMEGMARYSEQQYEVARDLAAGELSRKDALDRLRTLQNPLEWVRKEQATRTDKPTEAPKDAAAGADWREVRPGVRVRVKPGAQ